VPTERSMDLGIKGESGKARGGWKKDHDDGKDG